MPKIDFGSTFEEVGILEIYEIVKITGSRVNCKIDAVSPISEEERKKIKDNITLNLKRSRQLSGL